MTTLHQTLTLKVGLNRGTPRLYIASSRLDIAGLGVGAKFDVEYCEAAERIAIRQVADGARAVCRKSVHGRMIPLIELKNSKLSMLVGRTVTVSIRNGGVDIELHHHQQRAASRMKRLADEVASGEITGVELCLGGGVMADALHVGALEAGVSIFNKAVIEAEGAYLESAARNSRGVSARTHLIQSRLEDVDMDLLPEVSLLCAGLPCTGASLSGRAKRKNVHAEDHPDAGHLFVAFLEAVKQTNAAFVVLENVVNFRHTAGYSVIRRVLTNWGYTCSEAVFGRSHCGALENRQRLVMVAHTAPAAVRLESITPMECTLKLGDVLDDVDPQSPRWSEMRHLRAKEERDVAAGSNFRMQIVDGSSDFCPVITAGYSRVRSTDPKVSHPINPLLLRQISPAEHCRIKGAPESLIAGLSTRVAHQVLGQSVLWALFKRIGSEIGRAAREAVQPNLPEVRRQPISNVTSC